MSAHLVQNWTVRKPVARSRGGIVATQNRIAGEAGARILAAGGNAMDAAVATGFALAAVEPWNSGLGGVGFMLVYLAQENRVEVVDFGPLSPRALDPADYPLTGGITRDLFAWPTVKDDRNVHGPLSFAVPGHVDGLGLALEKFGSMKWAEVMQPAIEFAEQGIAVDWYLTLKVATMAKELSRYPATRDIWLPHGLPPVTPIDTPLERLQLSGLADTLRRIARAGRRDFYEGQVSKEIIIDINRLGGILAAEDLKNYRARIVAPLETEYRGAQIALAPGLTAGPSMVRALSALGETRLRAGGPHADAFIAYAKVLRDTYAERLQTMGETSDRSAPSTTTHLDVIDRHGNMVALTQTLLSVFGSKVVLPSTGILMNNGIMWFDPAAGTAQLACARCTTAYQYVPADRAAASTANPGSQSAPPAAAAFSRRYSRWRHFLIDHGMTLEDAFHQPRIDASGSDTVGIDPRLPDAIQKTLAEKFPVAQTELVVYPTNFACPAPCSAITPTACTTALPMSCRHGRARWLKSSDW